VRGVAGFPGAELRLKAVTAGGCSAPKRACEQVRYVRLKEPRVVARINEPGYGYMSPGSEGRGISSSPPAGTANSKIWELLELLLDSVDGRVDRVGCRHNCFDRR
jgi:hypothetical protein